MHVEYHKWWSPNVGRDIELKVYGHLGRPVLVFPAQGGRFFDFEDFGMVDACRDLVESGRVRFVTVDSLDNESWANFGAHPADRCRRHEDYDRYIVNEVVPFIHTHVDSDDGIICTGVSMGGYHAGNFFFRHPTTFSGFISLSGLFTLRLFVGDYVDDCVYFNSPLFNLPNLEDPAYLDQYRRSQIIVCAGRGAWEDEMLAEAQALKTILDAKAIPNWIDIWGHDVDHDWPWWRRQLPYYLSNL
jgi:esterase/lipase superfamily enzyme